MPDVYYDAIKQHEHDPQTLVSAALLIDSDITTCKVLPPSDKTFAQVTFYPPRLWYTKLEIEVYINNGSCGPTYFYMTVFSYINDTSGLLCIPEQPRSDNIHEICTFTCTCIMQCYIMNMYILKPNISVCEIFVNRGK